MRKPIVGPLILLGLLWMATLTAAAPNPAADPQLALLRERLAAAPGDDAVRLELAQNYFRLAGFDNYFESQPFLWSESSKRRSDLQSLLPAVDAAQSRLFREQLQLLLQAEPENQAGLLMAGAYHSFYHQKQTALWYYQRAVAGAPGSLAARLGLADYYLSEWLPDQALAALADHQEPLAALRRGVAYWQKGQYPLALGYLLQADPLPAACQTARGMWLARAYLAIGDPAAAAGLVNGLRVDGALPRVLLQEVKGWTAWSAGSADAARQAWSAGKSEFSKYRFWDAYLAWLQYNSYGTNKNIPGNWHDADLRSLAQLWDGYFYARKGDSARAGQGFLAAIQADHRSLLGFLEAGNQQLKAGKYSEAMDLFGQGLAVNPNFGPLLRQRGEAYRMLKQTAKAEADQHAAAQSLPLAKSTLLDCALTTNGGGNAALAVSGATRELLGLWLSPDGVHWQWEFWRGGPIVLNTQADALWVVPAGTGLAGETIYVQKPQTAAPGVTPGLLVVDSDGLKLTFPDPVRLVVADRSAGGAYVQTEPARAFAIPLSLFKPGSDRRNLRLWYQGQDVNGEWRHADLNLKAPAPAPQLPAPLLLAAEAITGRDWVQCQVTVATEDSAGLTMALSEVPAGSAPPPAVWQPFQPQAMVRLSGGDGPKTILLRIRDRSGATMETSTVVQLDTTPPRVADFRFQAQDAAPQRTELTWHTSEPVTATLRVFRLNGGWQDLDMPAQPAVENEYRTELERSDIGYVRLRLKDRAGNLSLYDPADFNAELARHFPVRFQIGDGPSANLSGWITIRPAAAEPGFSWSVSNDLQTWSPWRNGSAPLAWRLAPETDAPLVYIRCRFSAPEERTVVLPVPATSTAAGGAFN